jgi:prepilin peptidase CpaA
MTTISQHIPNTKLDLSLPSDGNRTAIAFGSSLAIVGILMFPLGGGMPLPFLEWTGAFLLAVITMDLRDRRIPNWLTFPALSTALVLAWDAGGSLLLREALIGAGAVFLILFPAFALRALGAGDVKALMVLGALWGTENIIPALPYMAGAGAFLSLARVALAGELGEMLGRWFMSIKLSILNRSVFYIRPAADSAASTGIPFAVAIGLGAITFQWVLTTGGPFV